MGLVINESISYHVINTSFIIYHGARCGRVSAHNAMGHRIDP